ncbi:glucose-1-phosphate thymidylyltransferase, partial [Streptomyces chrestomyceticus]
SRIVGPAIIGAGTVVRDSRVGPFASISEDCTIDGTEVESSIILQGASIVRAGRIEDSLIGRSVRIMGADEAPRGHRLVLGDHSEIRIAD